MGTAECAPLVEHCPKLTSLAVSGCSSLSIDGDSFLKMSKKSLTSFQPKFPALLEDGALSRVAKQCSNLAVVNVSGCVKLTDASLLAVAEHCKGVTTLAVSGCPQLTVPDDTRQQGNAAVAMYYQRKLQGE